MKKLFILFALISSILIITNEVRAQEVNVEIEADGPPPALPEYVQPPCTVDGYLWCPGYWAYAPTGYYWVPGVWVRPPHFGLLWTPGYWAFYNGRYGWHSGYWGERIGFYGGICYGYGYSGMGFYGGRWEGDYFQYNTYVCTVDPSAVRHTYTNNIGVTNTVVNHTGFNGEGGVKAVPTSEELAASKEKRIGPTTEQQSHQTVASQNKKQFFSANKGKPATTAMNSTDGQHFNKAGKADKAPKEKAAPAPARTSSSAPVRSSRGRRTSFKTNTKVGAGIKPSRSRSSYSSSSSGSGSSRSGSTSRSTSTHTSTRSSGSTRSTGGSRSSGSHSSSRGKR